MHLVQVLLPLFERRGRKIPEAKFVLVQKELTARFGGVTAYSHSPATGLWKKRGEVERDRIILIEVVSKDFGKAWWKSYRRVVEKRFKQKQVLIRALKITLI